MTERGIRWWGNSGKPGRNELFTIAAIVMVFGVVAARIVASGAPLGHDEAVYALKSRQMQLGGSSDWFWNDYRSPGLPLLLQVTWLVSGTEPFLRMSVWVFGAAGVILTWYLGRLLFDVRTGLIAAAGLAMASPWIASSTSVWPDVPGAVLGLAAITVVYLAVQPDRTSWAILIAAPIALAAVLIRYGAPVPMLIGILVVLATRWRAVVKYPWPVATLGSIVGLGTLLMLTQPSIVGANGSPLSSIRILQAQNSFPISQGIRDYIRQGDVIIGGYAGLLLVLGLVAAVVYYVRRREGRRPLTFVFVWAALTTLVLLVILHGEYRYLAPVFPLFWVLAGSGLADISRQMASETALTITVVLALLVPLNALTHADFAADQLDDRFGDLRVVSRSIEAVEDYEQCGVITSYIPQVAWYSECVTRRYEATPVLTSAFFVDDRADYILWVTGGKRQPDDAGLAAYLDETTGIVFESGEPNTGNLEYAVVYEVANG